MGCVSAENYLAAFNSGVFADFSLKCDDKSFAVHRLIICADSYYFNSVCTQSFMERDQGFVDLSGEVKPDILEKVLTFIYAKKIDSGLNEPESAYKTRQIDPVTGVEVVTLTKSGVEAVTEHLLTQVRVYVAADRFGMEMLKKYCVKAAFKTHVYSILQFPEFVKVVEEVFTTVNGTDVPLRHYILDLCITRVNAIEINSELEMVLKSHEPDAWRVARKVVSALQTTNGSLRTKINKNTSEIIEMNTKISAENVELRKKITIAHARITEFTTKYSQEPKCPAPTCQKILDLDSFPGGVRYHAQNGFFMTCNHCDAENRLAAWRVLGDN